MRKIRHQSRLCCRDHTKSATKFVFGGLAVAMLCREGKCGTERVQCESRNSTKYENRNECAKDL